MGVYILYTCLFVEINMDPKLWGPSTWQYLHSLPGNSKPEAIGKCLNCLALPCSICQESFEEFKEQNPPIIDSEDKAHAYISSLHNYVNRKLGKQEYTLEECKKRWCLPKKSSKSTGAQILEARFDN